MWRRPTQELLSIPEQNEYIERTFEAANTPIDQLQHPKKEGVYAVKALPILPDFEFWKYGYVNVDVSRLRSRSRSRY